MVSDILTTKSTILDNLSFTVVAKFIAKHKSQIPRMDKLKKYYDGDHPILSRDKRIGVPNNKIVCNHAKEIADTATGYFIGNPISYKGDKIEKLHEWFRITDIDTVDAEIGKDMSVYGKAYELVHMSSDKIPTPKSYKLDPRNTFIVYDDTVEHKKLFAVYYYPTYDIDDKQDGYKIYVYTSQQIIEYTADNDIKKMKSEEISGHPFGRVPMIEFSNNADQQGDFEQVLTLIDAYNLLMSDRVNDKEQFVDAILILINAILGETEDENKELIQQLKQEKLLVLPGESDARYLTREFNEQGVEVLRKALDEDIHKFSNIPCMSDVNFAGTQSGEAIGYKLLGLEMITKMKERYYKAGLRQRFELYGEIMHIKGDGILKNVDPTFARSLPKDLVKLASIVSTLSGLVPERILLSILPFVTDVEQAVAMLAEEKQQNAQTQKDLFGMVNNTPPEDGEADDEE